MIRGYKWQTIYLCSYTLLFIYMCACKLYVFTFSFMLKYKENKMSSVCKESIWQHKSNHENMKYSEVFVVKCLFFLKCFSPEKKPVSERCKLSQRGPSERTSYNLCCWTFVLPASISHMLSFAQRCSTEPFFSAQPKPCGLSTEQCESRAQSQAVHIPGWNAAQKVVVEFSGVGVETLAQLRVKLALIWRLGSGTGKAMWAATPTASTRTKNNKVSPRRVISWETVSFSSDLVFEVFLLRSESPSVPPALVILSSDSWLVFSSRSWVITGL